MQVRTASIFAGMHGALGIALGAFGAHGLKKIVSPDLLVIWETAVRYHLYASLFIFALLLAHQTRFWSKGSFVLMSAGSLIFSLSLYALVLSGIRVLGAITPIGGVLMISAWLVFCWQIFKQKDQSAL